MHLDLVTIGDLNMDTLMSVPRFPGPDDEVQVLRVQRFAGGDAANIAVSARKLGLRTALIASVGCDADGSALLEELARYGVNTHGIQSDSRENTGSVTSMIRPDGERSMLTYRGANQQLLIGQRQRSLFQQSRAIHISDPLPSIIKPLAEVLKRSRSLISFDPGSITARRGFKAVIPILRQARIFLANEFEYLTFTGKKTIHEAAREIQSKGPEIMVVKLGRKGCAVITEKDNIKVPACRVRAVDSTGAGDAFDAAFITGLLENMPLRQAARFANGVGALATIAIGAQAGLPTRDRVEQFITGQ